MSKLTLADLGNISNTTDVTTINANSALIETAVENTLSLDGTQPNAMESNLDMNQFRIINLPEPISASEPLRLTDYQTLSGGGSISVNAIPVGGSTGTVLRKTSGTDLDATWSRMVLTNPATVSTLTIADNKTATINNTLTLAGTDGTTVTFQGTDTYVGRATTDGLTNKTFDTAGAGNVFKINGTQITAKTGTGSAVLATSPTLVTPVLGVASATGLTCTGPTSGLGYTAGAGGTVTQITSRATAVTLNKLCGQITMFSAAGSATPSSFNVNNTNISTADTIVLTMASGNSNTYVISPVAIVNATSFAIVFYTTGGTAVDAPVINFTIIKGSTT